MAYLIAEIGINHNASLDTAFDMIYEAVSAGFDAVKFQKREPRYSTPSNQWHVSRETPWGTITYLQYREKMEFNKSEFMQIRDYCEECKIDWFASVWDIQSFQFMKQFDNPIIKIPSAKITELELLREVNLGRKNDEYEVVISTGMSTEEEIDRAVEALDHNCVIMHTTSTYPCPLEELNLSMIHTLKKRYNLPIGYSGHEVGLSTTVAAAAMGAEYIERHITLDRAMWGTDQAASVEPAGMKRLVRDIRAVEAAMGDGVKHVYPSEQSAREKLRGGIRAVENLKGA